MTLPNVGKPSASDTVETIVADIQENFAFLETEPSAYCVKVITYTVGGYETVSGVGFEPRIIIFFANSVYGEGGYGYYGPSTTYKNFHFCRESYITGGLYYDRHVYATVTAAATGNLLP